MKTYSLFALCAVVCFGRSVFCMEQGGSHEPSSQEKLAVPEEGSDESLLRDLATLQALFSETKELVDAQESDLAVIESCVNAAERSNEQAIHVLSGFVKFQRINKYWKEKTTAALNSDWCASDDDVIWTSAEQIVWETYWDALEQLVTANVKITQEITPTVDHIVMELQKLAKIAKLDDFDARKIVDSLFTCEKE